MSTELPYAHYDLSITRDLGTGLLLRWSSSEDTEELVYLNSMVFRDSADAPPNTNLGNLVRELMSGRHPLMGPRDFAVIEDTRRAEHRIVACTCFWSQAWEYEGIHIGLGRPELVATDPAYRNRGLVRALFEEIHVRSEAQGDLVQGITGISYFYRQFGYEYALNLGGRSVTNLSLIPQAKGPEPYLLRDAAEADIPFILALYDRRRRESIVSSPIEERWLHYHLKMWNVIETDDSWHLQILSDRAGTAMDSRTNRRSAWSQGASSDKAGRVSWAASRFATVCSTETPAGIRGDNRAPYGSLECRRDVRAPKSRPTYRR